MPVRPHRRCYPIDFNGIDIEWYAGRGVYQLTVTGTKPYMNMDAR